MAFDENGQSINKNDLEPPFNLGEIEKLQAVRFGDEDISYINHIPDTEELKLIGEAEVLCRSYEDTFDLMYP